MKPEIMQPKIMQPKIMQPEIKQLIQVEEIYKTILSFNDDFMPSLTERGIDLKEYAQTLHEFAMVYRLCYEHQESGFVAFYANDNVNHTAYLTQIAVKSQVKNRGFGFALLKLAMETAKEKGMQTMKLEVCRQNHNAIEFYKKHGFIECNDVHGAFCYMKLDL